MHEETRAVFWGVVAATGAVFLVLLLFETPRPLRKQRESKLRRVARNLTAGGTALAVVMLLQTPFLVPVAKWVARRHVGLFNLIEMPRPVAIALLVVLLDYTLWIWHRVNHVVPFFWRFHLVHHHSNYRNEANGNWSSLLSAWDYLHGTVLLGVPQDAIEIGVPAYEREEDVTIGKILAMPFRRQREDWVGEDGPRLERPRDPSQKLELAE